jgi:putative methionine-R-sulfoxide reductase with GAF domain
MECAAAAAGERGVLSRIISTISSSLEFDEVLGAVVQLLSEASGVHACFVYVVEDERLVLRAASEPYSGLVGRIALERGEGLAWWVVEQREPAFIREDAFADPRFKHVPELEEERFQSLISVPIVAKGSASIGAITLHTEAPREFSEDEVEFLVSSASLVGGAIENARLYVDMRRRVEELERLTALGEAIARAETLAELTPAITTGALELLRARACRLYLLDGEALRLRESLPAGTEAPQLIELARVGPELARSGRSARIAVPLVAGDEMLGLLQADGTAELDLARAAANQAAVAIKKIELIERLTEKNLIKDFFEQLAGGPVLGSLDERAERLGCDLEARHLVLAARPASDALEKGLGKLAPGSLFDRRDDSLRGLLRIPPGGEVALLEGIRRAHAQLAEPVAVGVSNPCAGAGSFAAGFDEARYALLGTAILQKRPSVRTYDDLGPYKYLMRMSLDGEVRDPHRDAVSRLVAYDEERSSSLLETLEEFLHHRGNISATSEALHVHQNTLRQRLRRIMQLSGLDLRRDDWLMVELAVKLVRLQQALRPD